jgi:hypothetical protein
MCAVCGRIDESADVWIISHRVVEMVDFRVGAFVGLLRKLATAKELGEKDADGEAVEIPKRMDAEKAAFGWLDGE